MAQNTEMLNELLQQTPSLEQLNAALKFLECFESYTLAVRALSTAVYENSSHSEEQYAPLVAALDTAVEAVAEIEADLL